MRGFFVRKKFHQFYFKREDCKRKHNKDNNITLNVIRVFFELQQPMPKCCYSGFEFLKGNDCFTGLFSFISSVRLCF